MCPEAIPVPLSTPPDEPKAPEFDAAAALANVADDRELLAQMVELFTQESPRMLAAIRSSVDAGDVQALMRSAHALKGSVGNFGFTRSFEVARTLERMGREGVMTDARQCVSQLEAHVHQLECDLATFVSKAA
jgi:two-component system, sensor histidine kinase and response regulator